MTGVTISSWMTDSAGWQTMNRMQFANRPPLLLRYSYASRIPRKGYLRELCLSEVRSSCREPRAVAAPAANGLDDLLAIVSDAAEQHPSVDAVEAGTLLVVLGLMPIVWGKLRVVHSEHPSLWAGPGLLPTALGPSLYPTLILYHFCTSMFNYVLIMSYEVP